MQSLSSKLLEKAVEQFALLPGVGKKTALKYVLFMLKKKPEEVNSFLQSLQDLKNNIRECPQCHNIQTIISVKYATIPNETIL